MKTLNVNLTQDQYDRFKEALSTISGNPADDAALIAQMKREAAAITYAHENKNGPVENWAF